MLIKLIRDEISNMLVIEMKITLRKKKSFSCVSFRQRIGRILPISEAVLHNRAAQGQNVASTGVQFIEPRVQ